MPEPSDHDVVAPILREMLAVGRASGPPEPPAALRARSGRRIRRTVDPKLVLVATTAALVLVALLAVGAVHRAAPPATDVHRRGLHTFSVRPLLCFATPYSGRHSDFPSSAADGASCSTASLLTAGALSVTPDGAGRYTSRLAGIPAEDDAGFPSMTDGGPGNLLLSGASGTGPNRYVVGPAALTGTDVASTSVGGGTARGR